MRALGVLGPKELPEEADALDVLEILARCVCVCLRVCGGPGGTWCGARPG
jgi:hypothetical protein